MKKQFENFLKTKTFLILYLIQPVSSGKRGAVGGERVVGLGKLEESTKRVGFQ